MPRRKAGRPKNKLPHQYQFVMPVDTDYAKAKRAYWLVREMEKLMSKDIGAVKPKDYMEAVTVYADLCDVLTKRGYRRTDRGKIFKPGMDSEVVAGNRRKIPETDVVRDGQTELGAGISAINPIT